jgi:hypothetical protein
MATRDISLKVTTNGWAVYAAGLVYLITGRFWLPSFAVRVEVA